MTKKNIDSQRDLDYFWDNLIKKIEDVKGHTKEEVKRFKNLDILDTKEMSQKGTVDLPQQDTKIRHTWIIGVILLSVGVILVAGYIFMYTRYGWRPFVGKEAGMSIPSLTNKKLK